MSEETYLGDGLYASFDGYQIKLRAPREEGDHAVYLDLYVWDALNKYATAECWPIKEPEPTSPPPSAAEADRTT